MTPTEFDKLSPYERMLIDELIKLRKAVEALKED